MAKTWKTHPTFVRMASGLGTLAKEDHDHSVGLCDLPAQINLRDCWRPPERCRWVPTSLLLDGRHGGHSCTKCGRQNRLFHRLNVKTERAKVRLACRMIVKGIPPDEIGERL